MDRYGRGLFGLALAGALLATGCKPTDPHRQLSTGLPKPIDGVYTDLGAAPDDQPMRGLISFKIHDRDVLEDTVRNLSDPASDSFRHYLTPDEWTSRFAPSEDDVHRVTSWLESYGLSVPRIATNRLLIEITGTAGQFDRAFGVTLHRLERKAPQQGDPSFTVLGTSDVLTVPGAIAERIESVIAADLPVDPGPLPHDDGTPEAAPADLTQGLTPEQISIAYGVAPLVAQGFDGRHVKLGVAIGAGFQLSDLHAFWKTFGIVRADPVAVPTMESPAVTYQEGAADVEWSSAIAPGADVVVYEGPDARNTSLVFNFNEAIARGEVSVLTTSFTHREDSEPSDVRKQYNVSAMEAAALGITVLAASGDSAGVDVPADSPYVTAVGGTEIWMKGDTVSNEIAWQKSGSGVSRTFLAPTWQQAFAQINGHRGVADVSLNASSYYWWLYGGTYRLAGGTSFSAPVFAGLVAVVDDARASRGMPSLGYLNPLLYTRPEIQATFRDVTSGGTPSWSAGPGWDLPTGWGAPDAEGLLATLP